MFVLSPDFLRRIAAPFRKPEVGGVTCLYRGLTDGSLASDFEALGNSTDFAPGVLVAWLLGDLDFMLGAVMATTKAAVRGDRRVRRSLVNYLSDDYELGNRIAKSGQRVELSDFRSSIVYPKQRFCRGPAASVALEYDDSMLAPWGHLGLSFHKVAVGLVAVAVAPRWWIGRSLSACLRCVRLWLPGVCWRHP